MAKESEIASPAADGQVSCGEGAPALVQVYPVMFQVEQIVENVGSRRSKTEAEEGRDRDQHTRCGEGMGQQQGQEDEQVLSPLMHPEGSRQGNREARAVQELFGSR